MQGVGTGKKGITAGGNVPLFFFFLRRLMSSTPEAGFIMASHAYAGIFFLSRLQDLCRRAFLYLYLFTALS